MKDYTPKSHGVSFLRHAVAHRNKKLNYIIIPMEKAQEIIEASAKFQPTNSGVYSSKSNSVRGASVILAMDLKELVERLNSQTPANLLNQLSEAKNKIKALEKAGDLLAKSNNQTSLREWVNAKTFV